MLLIGFTKIMRVKDQAQLLAEALFLAAENKKDAEKQKIVKNFLEILKNKRKIYLLPRILKEFKKYSKRDEVELILSRKIYEEEIEKIKRDLRKVLGEKKMFKIKIDESIISGFIAKSNNYLIDASIKGVLRRIKAY